jgi:hypothetical protein
MSTWTHATRLMAGCSTWLVVRLTPKEHEHILRVASLRGITPSDLIRDSLALPTEAEREEQPERRRLRVVER